MTRSSNKKINPNLEKEALEEILKEIKKINSQEDLNKFFDKFFTKNEKDMIVKRVVIMDLLNRKGKYLEIKNMLEVSKITISNVKDIIDGRGYGKNPNRKRIYSPGLFGKNKKFKSRGLKYKGVSM